MDDGEPNEMKIKAEMLAYSSVVGSGVNLTNEAGRMIWQIIFMCHTDDLRGKDTQERMARIICDAINKAEATQ